MSIILNTTGAINLLDKMLKTSSTENYILKLYKNNYTPTIASEISSFTECTFSGYAAKTLTRSGWSSATNVGGKASMSYSVNQTWTAAGDEIVYGYFVVGSSSGDLLWAEKFDTPVEILDGNIFELLPKFTLS